ncbi:MAG: UDP-N-acetylglucosamine 1-carboxyvinyltransferase [Microgenomates group bacterium]
MAKFIIEGGKKLKGEVWVSGNKNSVLPLMAACLLTDEDCVLENVPRIGDVIVLGELMKDLGAKIEGLGTNRLVINCRGVKKYHLNPLLVSKLRASILLLGPLLARFRKALLRHPGGCMVGRRPVDIHFQALEKLGAKILVGEENYEAELKKPKANRIFLTEVSVTATENAMLLASLIPGKTIIEDAACEPHIQDLGEFLNLMGAKIKGLGTNRIEIEGVKKLHGATFKVGPDYIDAGTFAIIGAVTQGEIKIRGIRFQDFPMISYYFQKIGMKFKLNKESLEVYPSKLQPSLNKFQTRPWPGFPTDLMSPFIVLATQAQGVSLCHDWMYESRMFFVDKLITMGANITLCDPHRVIVAGPTKLRGKELESPDIRAGMALICAALCAEGKSEIGKIEIIERGYERIEERLKSLGAEIKRVE